MILADEVLGALERTIEGDPAGAFSTGTLAAYAPALIAEVRRLREAVAVAAGAGTERAAIAGWLRRCGNPGTAAAILRGEHER